MTSPATNQSTNLTLEVTMSTITSPLPYIPADALRGAYGWLTKAGAVRVFFDARLFGADVDEVSVSLRDLEFIHSVDAARFGSVDECPFCNER
jgi:hypothetical protein